MTPAALKAELGADPASLGYAAAAGDHRILAELLNARSRQGRIAVEAKVIRRWMILAGVWPAVKARAKAGEAAAETVIDALDAFSDFDFADNAVFAAASALLDALIAGGALTPAHKAAVLGLGDAMVSRAEELWGAGSRVTPSDVADALRD